MAGRSHSSRLNGPIVFLRELWDLPAKDQILVAQRAKIDFLFRELAVDGSRAMVDRYIRPVAIHRPLPVALREGVVTG